MKPVVIRMCLCIFLLFSCTTFLPQQVQCIRIKGSDTMVPLLQLWAEEFMKTHAGISIYTEGGGTATGIEALVKNQADISAASRPLRSLEAQKIAQEFGAVGVSVLVGKDALSVYLHPDNPVRTLSMEDLRKIFIGEIINWSELIEWNQPIKVLIRPPNSGTHLYFKEHVLQGESYRSDAIMISTTDSIESTILRSPNSIGYGGMGRAGSLTHCHINGIAPTGANVIAGLYPITRYLYLYTVNTPRGVVKKFIDWVLSPQGQKVVEEANYFPIWAPPQ